MFDAICLEKGFADNAALARDFCAQTQSQGEAAYDAAIKNLSNWRRGQHLPHRKNFNALTVVLSVTDDPDLLVEWNRLYSAAKSAPKSNDDPTQMNDPTEVPPAHQPSWLRSPVIGASVAALILVAGYGIYQSIAQDPPHSLPPEMIISREPIDMTDGRIYWREVTELKVGDYAVIHAKRGKCGEQPPSWEDTLKFLPELPVGVWFDGGVGYRVSRSCGGATPARAVVMKATIPGTVNFMLYEDPITITVK